MVWECHVLRDPRRVAERLDRFLKPQATKPFAYDLPARSDLLKVAERRADYNVLDQR